MLKRDEGLGIHDRPMIQHVLRLIQGDPLQGDVFVRIHRARILKRHGRNGLIQMQQLAADAGRGVNGTEVAQRVAAELRKRNKGLPKRQQQYCGTIIKFADSDDEEEEEDQEQEQEQEKQYANKLREELQEADKEDKKVQRQKMKEARERRKAKERAARGDIDDVGGVTLLNPVESDDSSDEDDETSDDTSDDDETSDDDTSDETSDDDEDEDEDDEDEDDEENDEEEEQPAKKTRRLEEDESLALRILEQKK